MNPKLEDLRKKAFVLYNGMDGVELVNKEIKRFGIKEDKLNQYQLKILLNTIIKNIFIDHIGLEVTKNLLAQDVTHIPGYHTYIEEDTAQIHILERVNFTKWFVVFVVVAIALVCVYFVNYASSFNPLILCDKKKSVTDRDSCYMILALNTRNNTLCGIVEAQEKRYNCIGQIAIRTNDTDLCETIPGDELDTILLHDHCISCIAYSLRNKTLCTSFLSPIRQDECLMQIERRQTLTC